MRARLRVERAEGLVHQQHPRLVDQDPRDLDALLHAARQLRRVERLEAGQADQLQDRIAPARSRSARAVPRIFGPKATLSRTRFHGNSVCC